MEFNLNTFTTILVAIAPALSAIFSIIAGVVSIRKKVNKTVIETDKKYRESEEKQTHDIAIIKSKISSIEKQLSERK